jgi:hypothetical protein
MIILFIMQGATIDPQYFPHFNICIVLSTDVKFHEVLRNGYRAADAIEHDRRQYINQIWFYLMKPYFALMDKVGVKKVIADPKETEKARFLFDGPITALPIIRAATDLDLSLKKARSQKDKLIHHQKCVRSHRIPKFTIIVTHNP